jgi:hypothetical protein
MCPNKREAIRLALSMGRMQLRLGDEAQIVLRDDQGAALASRHYPVQRRSFADPAPLN